MLLPILQLDQIARRDVAVYANEQVVKGEQGLAIIKACLRHADLSHFGAPTQHVPCGSPALLDGEWQQDPVYVRRVWVDRNQGLTFQILGGIRHQTIDADRNNEVGLREQKVRKKATFNALYLQQRLEISAEAGDRVGVDVMFPLKL